MHGSRLPDANKEYQFDVQLQQQHHPTPQRSTPGYTIPFADARLLGHSALPTPTRVFGGVSALASERPSLDSTRGLPVTGTRHAGSPAACPTTPWRAPSRPLRISRPPLLLTATGWPTRTTHPATHRPLDPHRRLPPTGPRRERMRMLPRRPRIRCSPRSPAVTRTSTTISARRPPA
jgi:hypothetical protein